MTEDKPKATRKKAPAKPVAPEETYKTVAPVRGTVMAAALVIGNVGARRSKSVEAVQRALVAAGHARIPADGAGFWGPRTEEAALAETGETDPVKVALALGFTVL